METFFSEKDFFGQCDELIQSNFIEAPANISALLKILAKDELLFAYVKTCFDNFDFDREFSNAINKTPASLKVVLPKDTKKIVAFVLTILYMVDKHQLDFAGFLKKYFAAVNLQASLSLFITTMVVPFKRSVELLFNNDDYSTYERREPEEVEEANIPQEIIEKVIFVFRDIVAAITNNPKINAYERGELLVVAEGFKNALITRDVSLIKITWIGFKYTYKSHKVLEDRVDELRVLLKMYIDI